MQICRQTRHYRKYKTLKGCTRNYPNLNVVVHSIDRVTIFWSLKITHHHFVLSSANRVIQAMISDIFHDISFHRKRILSMLPFESSLQSTRTFEAYRKLWCHLLRPLSLLTTMIRCLVQCPLFMVCTRPGPLSRE